MAASFVPRADARNDIVQTWSPHTSNRSPRSAASRSPPPNGYVNGVTTNGDHAGANGGPVCGTEAPMPTTPPMTEEDEKHWRNAELQAKILHNVEEYGITRPVGHRVSFHYNSHVEDMHFGKTHPMKPWRLTLAKHLILGFGLQYAMDTYEAVAAGKDEVREFHDPDYVDFLSQVSPKTFQELSLIPRFAASIPPRHDGDSVELGPFNLSTSPGADCPVFDGMSTYLFLYTGATLEATRALTTNQSNVAINWSGGLHHAHKGEASGFCYINDIVLAILDMLRVYPRVLYIDIDVHHGDGVEEAFQRQPRVMTLSFHRYGPYDDTGHKFFPGTGDLDDVGLKGTPGEHFALNVPIPSGIDDRQYKYLFENVSGRTIEAFNPSAVVLQCGADSLGGDRLGQFNINIRQHGECISYIQSKGLPLLILGGGGYTARNVARAWCHETSLLTANELPDDIPLDIVPRPQAFSGNKTHGDGKMYPSFERLHKNECKDAELESMVKKLEGDLRYVRNSPWVKMEQLPREGIMADIMEEEDERRREGGRRVRERDPAGRGELR